MKNDANLMGKVKHIKDFNVNDYIAPREYYT